MIRELSRFVIRLQWKFHFFELSRPPLYLNLSFYFQQRLNQGSSSSFSLVFIATKPSTVCLFRFPLRQLSPFSKSFPFILLISSHLELISDKSSTQKVPNWVVIDPRGMLIWIIISMSSLKKFLSELLRIFFIVIYMFVQLTTLYTQLFSCTKEERTIKFSLIFQFHFKDT